MRRPVMLGVAVGVLGLWACADRNVDPEDLPPRLGDGGSLLPDGGGVDVLRVFVTSQTYDGDLVTRAGGGVDGLTAADTLCRQVGAALSTRRFKAYLSTAGSNPVDRIEGAGPWVLAGPQPTVAFPDRSALASGPTVIPLLTETGGTPAGLVWTGVSSSDCLGWTSPSVAAGMAMLGDPSLSGSGWLSAQTADCSTFHALYCFEAPP